MNKASYPKNWLEDCEVFSDLSCDQLQDLLKKMAGCRVAVIGDLMLDAYLIGPVKRISPEAPVPVLEVTSHQYKLGGAANVGRCLAELGAEVKLAGVVGDDVNGERLLEKALLHRLNTEAVITDPDRPTTCKTRVVAQDQQVIRLDQESTSPINDNIEKQLIDHAESLCQWADAIVLSDYSKGVLTERICRRSIEAAEEKPVVIDPKALPWDRFRGATVIKPNRHEAEQFAQKTLTEEADVFEAAKSLAQNLHIPHALITCGAKGITLASQNEENMSSFHRHHFPTSPRELVDVTGAGDVVSATLTLSLAAGADAPTAAWLANLAAGVKVGKFGVAPVTAQELLKAINTPVEFHRKVMSLDEAVAFANLQRRQGKRLVFTNGCFDLLHVGHVQYLERSRQQGDVLIVGVNSSASVKRLKGPDRPLQSENDRAQIVASQATVDAVVIFDEDTPQELVRALRPDILTKGGDYKSKQDVVGWDLVESWNGRVELIDLVEGRSTTSLINRAA